MNISHQSQVSNHQKGQSLLEVLLALGVAIIIIVSLSALAVYGLRNAQHGKNVETATRLAGQGAEQVRTVRDRQSWQVFRTYPVNSCFQVETSNWTLQQAGCGGVPLLNEFSNFLREIRLTDATTGAGEGRKITVTVFWTDTAGTNQINTDTILTQWQ